MLGITLHAQEQASPLPLGQISTDGMFVVSDPGHFATYARVRPGTYDVIAWIAPLAPASDPAGDATLRCIALTLVYAELETSAALSAESAQLLEAHDLTPSRLRLRFGVHRP